MKLVKVDEARPGQKTARDVTDLRGNLLFKAGTELTADLLERCKQRTVTHLFVEDGPAPAAAVSDTRRRQEDLAQDIDRMFAGADSSPVMAALREAAKRHALGRVK